SVNQILERDSIRALAAHHAHGSIVEAIRVELDDVRRRLAAGEALDGQLEAATLARRVAHRLARQAQPNLRSVINATGIVLHTNLGRAPVAESAAPGAVDARRGVLNLGTCFLVG